MVTPRSQQAVEPSSFISPRGPGHITASQCCSLISYTGWREQRVDPVTSLLTGIGEIPVSQRSGTGMGLRGLYVGWRKASVYLIMCASAWILSLLGCTSPGPHVVGVAWCTGVSVGMSVNCMVPGQVCTACVFGFIAGQERGDVGGCVGDREDATKGWSKQRCPHADGMWLFGMALLRGR